MMLGGSPHIVAEPPRFAQNISDKIIGTGLNLSSFASSTVTAARNKNYGNTVDEHCKKC